MPPLPLPPNRSGPLVDLITSNPTANRTVVLPLGGAAAGAADAANLTTAILDYLGSRDALTVPPPTVTVLPVPGGGLEVLVTFPPGADGTAGALTLLVDAQQPAPGLVTALGAGVSGTATLGSVDAKTQLPDRCVALQGRSAALLCWGAGCCSCWCCHAAAWQNSYPG